MSPANSYSRRPRVLQCITHLALGGAEQVAFSLLRGLRDDFDFGVFAVHGEIADGIGPEMRRELANRAIPFFTGTHLPLKWGGLLPGGLALGRAVRAFQPDIVHLHTEIPEACYAAMVALRPPRRTFSLVRTIHNSVYWHHWPRLGCWCERRMSRPVVAGVSEAALAAFTAARSRAGISPPPIPPVVIYNGIAEPPSGSPTMAGVSSRPLRLLFAGRFEHQKGADLLPEILRQVSLPAGRQLELVLHGAGAQETRLKKLAAQPPTGWTVTVLPPVPNLAAHLSEFDLVLLPSRFEGLPLVAVEALLAGVPVVGTDAPGLRETLPPGHPWQARAGDATSFAATLQQALRETASWPAVTARAREFAQQRFALAVMGSSYRELYTRALISLNPPAPAP